MGSEAISSPDPIVIVGASLAGARAAEHLRRQGFEGRIVLVGAEPHAPYDRPPLSKQFLKRKLPEEKLFLRPESFWSEKRIKMLLGRAAERLLPREHTVVLAGGEKLRYAKLLVATGARVRRLDCPGAGTAGSVHVMRTLDDAKGLMADVKPGTRVVVIGAGVIGAEAAAACREEGCSVTMLDSANTPLLRAFGREIGELYATIHREKGVDVRLGVTVARLEWDLDGRVSAVVLGDGTVLACDVVVVGIGVVPETTWLEGSGVALDRGVLVDSHCRTNVVDVWAAGDVARFWSDTANAHVAVESVDNAQMMAVVAADDMLGKPATHASVPYFWSDQYDLKLQSVGFVGDYERVVYRGSTAPNDAGKRAFAAFHMVGKKLRFFVGVNRLKEMAAAKRLIAANVDVTDEQLADESFALGSLAPAGT
jgi:3-phenylpropionate/trans-cinnamate dioxygenase ferredoxin reductase subunit